MVKLAHDSLLLQGAEKYLGHLKGKRIAMLISGGVDSSVAMALLKHVGAEVKGYYLKIWLEDEVRFLGGDCPWEEDVEYVEKVCEKLGCEFEVVPLQKEYFKKVVSYTINEVENGRTPNPDVMCNSQIKFGSFLDYISEKDYDFIASGHYAFKNDSGVEMKMAPDEIKDQTYFLSYLISDQLERLIFPIGCFEKSEVRELADHFDLANKDRKDSQGICFLGKLKFSEFVEHYLGKKPGDILDFDTGEKLGEHDGFYFYTLGQRKGIGLGGGPWYVVEKDIEKNIVYVSNKYFKDDKPRDEFSLAEFNWFDGSHTGDLNGLEVKLRHGEKMYQILEASGDEDYMDVKINESDQGIAPGQFAVFYENGKCLGSAVIQ
jgi:tRNA-specific 2-thiouridylase